MAKAWCAPGHGPERTGARPDPTFHQQGSCSMKASRILILGAAFAITACVTASARDAGDVAAKNKEMVVAFYNMIFQEHKVREALEKYVGDRYIQHNPLAPNGTEALI